MKKLLIAVALVLSTAPACTPFQQGAVVGAVAETPLDLAHTRLAKLTIKSAKARREGRVVPGSEQAVRLSDDFDAAIDALERGDIVEANAAMDRIEKEI